MNSDLKHLIRIQSIDLSIQEIRASIDRFPGISKSLDAKLSAATAAGHKRVPSLGIVTLDPRDLHKSVVPAKAGTH